jgi:aryl-alcohol dehydrogenase-like predicted oxidoreductase
MQIRRLGSAGPRVGAIGLGAMGMSGAYGPADDAESIATVRAALDAGITLIDTGDFYGMGHNELLLRDALRGRRRQQIVLSVKFGALRDPDGRILGNDGRPPAVKNFLGDTLTRLGTDDVDVYRPARVDPNVAVEETVGAIAELVEAGHVRHLGLSEAGAETIRRAQRVHPIADLQIEYSLVWRGIEAEILPTCRALGVGVTAYGVLSRGLLGGHWSRGRALAPGDFRRRAPRFSDEHLDRNLSLVERLRGVAAARARRRRSWRSRGSLPVAATSSRWWALARASGWRRRSARWTWSLVPRRLPSWRRRSRPRPSRASATTPSRWRCSTASAAPAAARRRGV